MKSSLFAHTVHISIGSSFFLRVIHSVRCSPVIIIITISTLNLETDEQVRIFEALAFIQFYYHLDIKFYIEKLIVCIYFSHLFEIMFFFFTFMSFSTSYIILR